jgi:anti-anti-sigma factor
VPEEPFEIVLAHLDGAARVKLRGDLDYPATIEHSEALQEVIDLRERVVLDLAEVGFIVSAGLRFLVSVARAHEGPVRLENAPPHVTRLLALTALIDVFELPASAE